MSTQPSIEDIFLGPVPPVVAKVFPGARVIPTTDEMDHTTAEDRYKLVAICDKCDTAHHFTGSRERFNQTAGEKCEGCGGTSFYGLISERTYNPLTKRKNPRKKK